MEVKNDSRNSSWALTDSSSTGGDDDLGIPNVVDTWKGDKAAYRIVHRSYCDDGLVANDI